MNPTIVTGRLPSRRVVLGVALVLATFIGAGVATIRSNGGTCDELGAHIPAGILAWKTRSFSGGVANPPLGQLLVGAGPVLFGLADHPLVESRPMLFAARIPVLALGVLLVALIAELGRRVAGPSAGLAAFVVAAFCPNLLAHSTLATLDLPATALALLACLLAWNCSRSPSPARFAFFALACGAAAETKFTSIHFIPALAVGAVAFGSGTPQARARFALGLCGAGLAGFAAIHAALTLGFPPESGSAFGLQSLVTKWTQAGEGHFSYLLGKRSADGFPPYFLVALFVKTPLPILGLALVGAFQLARGPASPARGEFLAFVAWPALWIFISMSFLHRVHIGLRHILPVFPALLTLAGLGAHRLAGGRRIERFAGAALLVWLAETWFAVLPAPLAYFNEVAGGSRGGERFLIDSNLDWGQDERALRERIGDRAIRVNPPGPVEGLVAANVNAVHGILQANDRRLGWVALLPPEERVGQTWRIVRADESAMHAVAARGPREAVAAASWIATCGDASKAVAILEVNDLSRHPDLAPAWHEAMAEALLAMNRVDEAARHLGAGVDPDLAREVAHRTYEERGTPWTSRDERVRSGIVPALLARGKAAEAESLVQKVLAANPADGDALRGLLLARLARRAGDDSRNRTNVAPDEPRSFDRALVEVGELPRGQPFDLFARRPSELPTRDRLLRAQILREAHCERRALEEVGALLAADPRSGDALEVYGELVVRRKLGVTEFPMPDVDWSSL